MIRSSVIIPTHNPDPARLDRVVQATAAQTIDFDRREILLIDNRSDPPAVADERRIRIVREPRLGLSWARDRGIREARGEVLVFVDDDNVLDSRYLEAALDFLEGHPEVAAIGGKIEPDFESEPPVWLSEFHDLLALRDFGEDVLISDGSGGYPLFAPVGAGMVIRRRAARRWVQSLSDRKHTLPDRQGADLSSSGDNDMIFNCLRAGERVAYVPALKLTHLIPAKRLSPEYLARLNRGIQKSWIQVLALNDACPWPGIGRWTLPLRKARAYFGYRGWQRPGGWIRWQGACGHFEGRAILD